MKTNELDKNPVIFALDIGTRSVVGLLGSHENGKIKVKHSAIEFHQTRAMYDGQIHDIEGVVQVARKVKEKLEEKAGCQLKEVAIAAAGRALKTCRVQVEKTIDEAKPIDKHLVNTLEIEALQRAQMQLEEEASELTDYFCIGHTIVNSYLNDGLITNLLGHRGNKVKIDVLATFLPHLVVDSLHTVMSKIGLEVSYMTLEPIAAIEVAVPQNLRLLNIALVDIGAGTSDIAITKDGTIVAYGMTSTAGDEITEAIAKSYLLDFDKAEGLKCNLCKEDMQKFTDIIGLTHEVKTDDILKEIRGPVEAIAKDICDNIISQNGKAPSVVFLIGGGSQLPSLPEIIAEMLDMPSERVNVRGVKMIQNLESNDFTIEGPDGITPIGILAKAIESRLNDFLEITVNNQKLKLFQSKQLKVSDGLALTGFNPRDLIPKRGKSITVYVNGKEKMVSGEYGEVAEIFVNNKKANLDEVIRNEDDITIIAAKAGKDAAPKISDIINMEKEIKVNGNNIRQVQEVKLNGVVVDGNKSLKNGDKIETLEINSVTALCDFYKLDITRKKISINGIAATGDEKINSRDAIMIEDEKEVKDSFNKDNTMEIIFNGSPLKINRNKSPMIFVDIFNYIDFDRNKVNGKLILKHNGEPANYTAPIKSGDEIIVKWE
ncbi:cell division protein FtsA [Alkaliphilus pronyensis]|uniref:Cell division protein FtsA n=1 Tax=Alkaliphilus pronyensis TaxID=1482732 RepID=A0A6I0F1J2_9FIRM|nr:pilus assembly protein PilM [Alkaliphilus pronyensis]KAB3534832.1 cell division protein FtsA [Alkaliphilus pronyensis]